MMLLSQRSADIAKRWLKVKTEELREFKKQQEIIGTVDYGELEAIYFFACCPWFCSISYSKKDYITLEFGYKSPSKPEYMRKILCCDSFYEDKASFDIISKDIDSYVQKQILCHHCDNGNKIFVDDMCKHCYIFGTTSEEDCAICLSKDFGVWLKTPCNHKFHYKCYNGIQNKVCPLCRTETVCNVHILDE